VEEGNDANLFIYRNINIIADIDMVMVMVVVVRVCPVVNLSVHRGDQSLLDYYKNMK